MARHILILSLGLALTGVALTANGTTATHGPETIVVKMVDKSATEFVFEPANVTVHPGDIVQFVQTGAMPHNVEFRDRPGESKLDGIEMGPYLTQPEETYEIVIDDRFAPGGHAFVCTPHEFMGMKGSITVEASSR